MGVFLALDYFFIFIHICMFFARIFIEIKDLMLILELSIVLFIT